MAETNVNYELFPVDTLDNLVIQYNDKMIEQKFAATPNPVQIKYFRDEMEKIASEIQRRKTVTAEPVGQIDQKPHVNYIHVQQELQNSMRDNVPSFQSGVDVHTFINSLKLTHGLYKNEIPTADFEKMFVRLATSKMSVEYASTMTNHTPAITNFEAMETYLKTHHASKMSCYQTLDVMWDLQQLESENLRDFARKLDEKAVESRNIIEAKFETAMKMKSAALNTDSESSNTAEIKMASKDVFQMLSGQIFLQMLKSKRPNVYNQIVNDLDQVWTAIDIANLAMSYEDRMAKDFTQNQATLPSTHTVESKSKQEFQNCWSYLNGKCNHGEKCNRNHDPDMKNKMDSAGLKFNKFGKLVKKGKNEKKDHKDKKPSGGGGNGETLVATLSNQVFQQ